MNTIIENHLRLLPPDNPLRRKLTLMETQARTAETFRKQFIHQFGDIHRGDPDFIAALGHVQTTQRDIFTSWETAHKQLLWHWTDLQEDIGVDTLTDFAITAAEEDPLGEGSWRCQYPGVVYLVPPPPPPTDAVAVPIAN